MTTTYLISKDTLKTIFQGALGAMTFGAYSQYNTNKIMELNNEKINIEHKYLMDKIETEHKNEMIENKRIIEELTKRLNNIEKANSNRWF